MNRHLLTPIIGAGLVAVACGPGATPAPNSTTAPPPVMTSISATGPTTASSTTTSPTTPSSADRSTTVPTTPATTAPIVQCGLIDDLAGTTVPVVTFSQDGYLWFVGADSTDCLSQLPDRVATSSFIWGPAGDTVLFADGTVIGVGLDRGPLADVAASLTWTRPTGTSTIHVATDGSLRKVSNDGASSSTLSPLTSHTSVAYHPDGTTFAVAGVDDPDPILDTNRGIWISKNDGSEFGLLESGDPGVVITEMTFSNDARFLMYVADHTADAFDDGYHLHYRFVEPENIDDTMVLRARREFDLSFHVGRMV